MATFLWPSYQTLPKSVKPREFFTYKLPEICVNTPLVQRQHDLFSNDYNSLANEREQLFNLGALQEPLLRRSMSADPTVLRGRGPGGMMKHVVQTTSQNGANILFMKAKPNPGEGSFVAAPERPVIIKVKLPSRSTGGRSNIQNLYYQKSKLTNLNARAKGGFKYWIDDKVRKAPGPPIGTVGSATGLPAACFSPPRAQKRPATSV